MASETENPFHCEEGQKCKRRKIVIACDGSEHSERALDFFLDNILQPDDHMIIYHAFELPPLPVAPYPYGFSYYEDWSQFVEKADHDAIELLQGNGKKCIEKMKKRFPDKDKEKPHIQLFKENGRAGELICDFCKDIKPSMLIVGSRGQGTLRRTFLGSVSDYCIHHNPTHCPVLVVPPPLEHTEGSETDKQD